MTGALPPYTGVRDPAAGLGAAAVVDNEGDIPGLCDLGFLSGLSGGSG